MGILYATATSGKKAVMDKCERAGDAVCASHEKRNTACEIGDRRWSGASK